MIIYDLIKSVILNLHEDTEILQDQKTTYKVSKIAFISLLKIY